MKSDVAHLLLQRVTSGIGYEFAVGDLVIKRAGIPEDVPDLRNAHIAISTYLSAFIRITSTLDDIAKIPRFGGRYAWRGQSFRRSDHIRFVWMAFLHLVYVYHERVRIFVEALDEASKYVPISVQIEPGFELKRLRKVAGPFVRERGQSVHEWYPDRQEATHLEAIEFLHASATDGDWDVKGHYQDIRNNMVAAVRTFHKNLSAYHLELFNRYTAVVDELMDYFNELTAIARADGLEVVADGPQRGWLRQGASFFKDRFG